MHDLTGFQRDLLIVIAGLDDPHGLSVKDELEEYYETDINHGRLYPNLDILVEKGQKDKRTNLYYLTQRGEESSQPARSGNSSTSAPTCHK